MSKPRKRRCSCCGHRIGYDRIRLCEECQIMGRGRRMIPGNVDPVEILQVAKVQQYQGVYPLEGMSMDDVAALAHCFKSPYNTYGKLKGYVEAVKRLPPEEFERRGEE